MWFGGLGEAQIAGEIHSRHYYSGSVGSCLSISFSSKFPNAAAAAPADSWDTLQIFKNTGIKGHGWGVANCNRWHYRLA